MAGRTIRITLQPSGVVAPILQALQQTLEVTSISVAAIQSTDFSKPQPDLSGEMSLRFEDQRSADEKQRSYLNWLFAKGFQEYARGVRHALEEAFFYNTLIHKMMTNTTPQTWGEFEEIMGPVRRRAGHMLFPKLLSAVNAGLAEPLRFEKEFLSLQRVRNCLEHRAGIVGVDDVQPGDDRLRLVFPRMIMFAKSESGEEIELRKNMYLEAGTSIGVKTVTENRDYPRGTMVTFTAEEIAGIGWGCWAFASELENKLPKFEPPQSAGS
jgi:hypothetical protein